MRAKPRPRLPRWKIAEQYVLHLLCERSNAFESNDLDSSERGSYLPRMRAAVPGQHGAGHGIDILAIDPAGRLWIIEVSIGTRRGATRFKGGGKPVKYAGGNLQMSAEWRAAAAELFLEEDDAILRLRSLIDPHQAMTDRQCAAAFRHLMDHHRKAVVIPLGAHFDTIRTDVDYLRDVYTYRFPEWFLSD
jgi:hypothetical protein